MPMAFFNSIIPAPTKASTIKLTTELLCRIAVMPMPLNIALRGWLVCRRRNFLKERPARNSSAVSKSTIANRKMPSPAKNSHISNCDNKDFFLRRQRSGYEE